MKLGRKLIAAALAAILMLSLIPAAAFAQAQDGYRWQAGQAMPVFQRVAGTLDAIDTYGLSFAQTLATACLQGIVNRTQPRILLRDADEQERDTWPDKLGLDYAYLDSWQTGVQKYLDELQGIVIWNPDVQDTANVATTIAGITDSLALTPELAEIFTAAPYHLSVVADLRDAPITDKISAYRYLYETYWADCTRKTISGLAPDGHTNLRDFSVAVKAAVVWLDAKVPAEREVLKLFFDGTTQLDTFYTGWWPDEPPGIEFASTYGVTTVPSDFYLNYTVYSGMSQKLSIPEVPAKPELDDRKIYVAALLSDGDNIQYDQGAMLAGRLWASPQRGEVPVGWTASPVMLDAGPQILNYYYKTATPNDVLVCGPSGLGYSTTLQWPSAEFATQYGALTNDYFERSAFRIITVWHELSAKRAAQFTQDFPSLLGLTTQGVGLKIRHTDDNVPIVWLGSDTITSIAGMAYESGVDGIQKNLRAAAKLPQCKAKFFACQGNVWFTSVSDFVRLRDELEQEFPGRFEFVRPDHFMMLVNEAYGKPYAASLQKRATASKNSQDAAKAFDGSFTTGWEVPAGKGAWLRVDLGECYLLDRYVLKNAETNYLDAAYNTGAWKLQVSTDGYRWRTVDAVSGNEEKIVYRDLQQQKARYVRLWIDDPGKDGTARVQDLEIHGIKGKDALPDNCIQELLTTVYETTVNTAFEMYYRILPVIKRVFG